MRIVPRIVFALLLAMSWVVSGAAQTAPGPIVVPQVAPAIGQMQLDAAKQQTDSAARQSRERNKATSPSASAGPSGAKAPAETGK
jgi:hypothetical protein